MRYRPGRRRTLRIDAWLRTPSGPAKRTWFGKLYHDAQGGRRLGRDVPDRGRPAGP